MSDPITELTDIPSTTDPLNFAERADNFLNVQLPRFVDEVNAVAKAYNRNSVSGVSSSNVTIGLGSKSFVTDAAKSFMIGMTVKVGAAADGSKWMLGDITAYDDVSGAITVYVTIVSGSGTFNAWALSLASTEQLLDDSITAAKLNDLFVYGITSDDIAEDDFIPFADVTDSNKKKKGTANDIIAYVKQLFPLSAAVASNALTVTIGKMNVDFRHPTLANGSVNKRKVTASQSIVAPSGASFGATNAVAAKLAVLLLDNAGTPELAICNAFGGLQLDETNLISTTAIGASATSATTIYSVTARSNVPYRVLGYIDVTEATAGVYATAPSKVQPAGGSANASLMQLGIGQAWQSLTGSRSSGVTYTNSTGKPIMVSVATGTTGIATVTLTATVNGTNVGSQSSRGDSGWPINHTLTFIVPPNGTYSVTYSHTLVLWAELR